MTAQVTRVRTTGPVQTESTDSTAAAHQDLTAHSVKQVSNPYYYSFKILSRFWGPLLEAPGNYRAR